MKARRHKTPAQHLPANKVLWVLLAQAAVIVPHALHLPSWILVVAIGTGIWRYHATRRQWRAPGLLLRSLLIAIGAGAVYGSYGTLFGRDAGVAMIVLMLALKVLELNRRRDVVVFVLLGYFLVLTNFLYSQSVFMAVYMLAAGVLLTSALASVQDPGWQVRPTRQLRLAARLMLQAAPLALLLFLLFPRISGPLWSLPDDAHSATTGLSERMSPGSVSRLARSNAVAFRVQFSNQAPQPWQLYWRGPVLDHYDGQQWSPVGRRPRARYAQGELEGPTVDYQVTLEAHGTPWLLALEMPTQVPPRATLTGAGALRAPEPVLERTRYRLQSQLSNRHGGGTALTHWERQQALQLPVSGDPRARALGHELARTFQHPDAIVNAVLQRFYEQEYVYTLEPPLLGPVNSVDQFLFESRAGFCEHYAGAFVVIMRAAGIPARVVTGYQGGERNPNDDYWIVRQSDAHAWAEVWIGERGWVRVDPTGAIAPERIQRGIEAALPEQVRRIGLASTELAWLRDAGLVWDALNNRWNQWVLGYGAKRQMEFLRDLGFERPHWFDLALLAAATVATGLLLLAAALAFRHRAPAPSAAMRAYSRLGAKLARAGLPRRSSEGPIDYANRVASRRPDLGPEVLALCTLFADIQYGRTPRDGALAELKRRVDAFSTRAVAGTTQSDAPTPSGAGTS